MTERAAQDFEAFYEQNKAQEPEDSAALLLLSADAGGVRVRKEGMQRARTFTLIVDFIHTLHYLWIAAKELRSSAVRWVWVAYYAGKLLRCETDRDVSRIAAGITRCATNSKLAGKALASVHKCTRYLLANKAHLHFATYLALGYPIATGAIEGAIRYLLRDRMDITGASWGLPCGEAVLRLRAQHSNDDFDEYWEFHLTQEKLRHFPASPDNDNAFCVALLFLPEGLATKYLSDRGGRPEDRSLGAERGAERVLSWQ